jgi:hypothetical protein
MCCIFVFCLVKWNNGVKEIWSCDLYEFDNLKPFYDEEGGFFASFWIKFKWWLARASVKFEKMYLLFNICMFCILFVCVLVFCDITIKFMKFTLLSWEQFLRKKFRQKENLIF